MDVSENITNPKKEKIKIWLKNPYNFCFLAVLIAIIVLRVHYFLLTKNQPLWWDESEYLAIAKNYAGIVSYEIPIQRLPGFPLLVSIFYILGLTSESLLRFLVCFIPSIIAIVLMYFCIKEMYSDRRIAIISLAIFGVLWEHLFYSNRFHTENFGLVFDLLAIFILFKSYLKKENLFFIKQKYSLVWIFFFALIAGFFRPGNLVFLVPLFVFLIFVNKSKLFSKKTYPIWIVLLILLILGFFFFDKLPLPKEGMFSRGGLLSYFNLNNKIAWDSLTVFKGFYESINPSIPNILYYVFLLGFLIIIGRFFLYPEALKKLSPDKEDLESKSDIFNLSIILLILAYFIFGLRSSGGYEYRWFFPLLISMFVLTSKGIIYFSEFVAGFLKNKKLAILFILIILGVGVYTQFVHADSIIRDKLNSYIQVKDASLWMKANSEKGDIILSRSTPQTAYYSERKTYGFAFMNETQFLELVNKTHPKFMLESALEPNPAAWGLTPPKNIEKILNPVNAWFADADKKQAILIVYEFNQQNLPIANNFNTRKSF